MGDYVCRVTERWEGQGAVSALGSVSADGRIARRDFSHTCHFLSFLLGWALRHGILEFVRSVYDQRRISRACSNI